MNENGLAGGEPPVWDLRDLYASLDDPKILSDLASLQERAAAFEQDYQGKIAAPDCTPERLRAALDEYEEINRLREYPATYAELMFWSDTSDPARGSLLQKVQVQNTAISRHLIFFDLEIGAMPDERYRSLIDSTLLDDYRHYLNRQRAEARHHLTAAEEKVIAELSNTGHRAFLRLFSEITSRMTFPLTLAGESRQLNQSELFALMYEPDRDTRRTAAEALTGKLHEESHVLSFIYNNLLQHRATLDRLRGYAEPEQERHESNELSAEVVDTMVQVCVDRYDLPERYYRLKQRILGLDRLTHYDRYAPLAERQSRISFEEARELVLASFAEFSPVFRTIAAQCFEQGWIDARTRKVKRGGAFCTYVGPRLHPYVFMNYTNNPRDVMTLAHELGHALHGVLAGRKHNYLNFMPSLPTAETASVFGEMLVFERLQQQISDPHERLALFASKIEDTLATVFRQATMFRFEKAAHRLYRAEGEQTVEEYNRLWQSTMQEMFGRALELGDGHACWWLHVPHLFATPFYVYAYSFGELLVLALFARYRQEGAPFVGRYLELLSTGGSRKPEEMLASMGIDIRSRDFWMGGMELIESMIARAEAMAAEIGAAPVH